MNTDVASNTDASLNGQETPAGVGMSSFGIQATPEGKDNSRTTTMLYVNANRYCGDFVNILFYIFLIATTAQNISGMKTAEVPGNKPGNCILVQFVKL